MILVCQPLPVALNAESTSSDSRIFTGFLGDAVCGLPLLGRTAMSSLGKTSLAGLNFLKSSFVNSRTSPSLSVKGNCFAISFRLPFVSLPKTNYSDSIRDWCETKNVQPVLQVSNRYESPFWIRVSFIFKVNRILPIKFRCLVKRQFSLILVFFGFDRVEFNFHGINVYTKNLCVKNEKEK